MILDIVGKIIGKRYDIKQKVSIVDIYECIKAVNDFKKFKTLSELSKFIQEKSELQKFK